MDFEKFSVMVSAPLRTRNELLQILQNVRGKAGREYEAAVVDTLNQRFPGWDRGPSPRRGPSLCVARFRGEARSFHSAKDGYIWLVEKLFAVRPELLAVPSHQTAYVALGRDRLYFARTPKALFPRSPNLAEESGNYVRLSMGWYANTNLSNDQKFELLTRVSACVGLHFKEHWDWQVVHGTAELKQRQQDVIEGRAILDELIRAMDAGNHRPTV